MLQRPRLRRLTASCCRRLLRPTAAVTITASSTRNRFTLYVEPRNASAAEQACQANGGHLASFASRDEQLEVEQSLVDTGYLLPSYHKQYWMGLATTDESWPSFRYAGLLPCNTRAT
jgi:hypothetical protein